MGFNSFEELTNLQTSKTTKYKIHEQYDPSKVINDIALIKTETFTINFYVQPLCLPPPDIELGGLIMTGRYI